MSCCFYVIFICLLDFLIFDDFFLLPPRPPLLLLCFLVVIVSRLSIICSFVCITYCPFASVALPLESVAVPHLFLAWPNA